MTEPREEWQLDTRRLARRVLVYDQVASTNTLAAEFAAAGATEGIALLADEQTAGRGQHGRSWLAGPGDCVLLSVLLSPPPALRQAAVLTAWAAVSVCTIVRQLVGRQARIKWPNDVLVSGRKVCGILLETSGHSDRVVVVAGIGLNVRQTPDVFTAAGLPEATSLAAFTTAPLQTADVARRLLLTLDEEYDLLCGGEWGALESCWKWHVGLLGKEVVAETPIGTYHGRLHDMTFHGIHLECPGARPLFLRPERILHLRPG
jgi:BirA family biotin operon repressor/biotin-[acetyl-CoA-carboxylase] ligase